MSLYEYPVLGCPGRLAFLSSRDDFSVAAGRAVASSRMRDPDVSPYCFDFAKRSLLCVSAPDIAGATFFYQAQRQHARSVIEIPFASLPEGAASPTLIGKRHSVLSWGRWRIGLLTLTGRRCL